MRDVLELVPGNQDPTLAANAARMATFCRHGSENFHAPLKNQNQHLSGTAHNSRVDAIGQETLNHYNQRYDRHYGPEWAEVPLLYVEYLVAVGRYNEHHPKFSRYIFNSPPSTTTTTTTIIETT